MGKGGEEVKQRTSSMVEIKTELEFERMKSVVSASVRVLIFFNALTIAGCYSVQPRSKRVMVAC